MIPAVFLYSPTGKIFCQIIRMNILMLDQTLENMVFLFGFCAMKSIQFFLADQKSGNTFCKMSIFSDLIRISGNSDDSNYLMIMINRKIDSLLGSGKSVSFCYFDYFAADCRLSADFVKISDPFFICARKDNTEQSIKFTFCPQRSLTVFTI